MNKLAHSDHRNMARIDIERAIESGNEDCVGLRRLAHHERRWHDCNHTSGPNRYPCCDVAEVETLDGKFYCERHAVEALAGTA
jgi:hypothetical protein